MNFLQRKKERERENIIAEIQEYIEKECQNHHIKYFFLVNRYILAFKFAYIYMCIYI